MITELINKKRAILIVVLLLVFSFILISLVLAQNEWRFSSASSNPQYYPSYSYRTYSQSKASMYWPILEQSDKCEAATDFLMNVQPGSCRPAVVRSDLLEEQNVPVFCKVDVIKLNPLIDVSEIKSVSFSGSSPFVVDVGFHPNQEAITSYKEVLDNPLINDVGYVVVLLRKTPAEKDMPESVKINLTARIAYDAKGLFGPGEDSYYLEVMDNDEWNENYNLNSIFKGKAYLRAEWVDKDKARISIYRDKEEKLISFDLEKGKSREYYIPGFYCKAKLKLTLDDVVANVKKVKLLVNDEELWLVEGERFLNGLCKISKIEINNDNRSVKIDCRGQKPKILTQGSKKTDGAGEERASELTELLEGDVKTYFEKTKEEAEHLADFYPDFGGSDLGDIWAAKALYQLGLLAEKLEQKQTAYDIFLRLINEYTDTEYARIAKMNHINTLGNPDTTYNENYIKLLQVLAPSKEDASVDFEISKDGRKVSDEKFIQEGQVVNKEYKFKLNKLYRDKVDLTCYKQDNKDSIDKTFTLEYRGQEVCSGYTIKLNNINLKEVAKVSAEAVRSRDVSSTEFSVEIGIEKRAIKLTPEKALERIANLNKSIEKWTGIVNNLGKVVSGMKAACFATSTVLLIKNFFSNLKGGATARQQVMPVYYAKCKQEVGSDRIEFNKCLEKYDPEIKKAIELYEGKIKDTNDELVRLQKDNTREGIVNTRGVVSVLLSEDVFRNGLSYDKYVINEKTGEPVLDETGKQKTEAITISRDILEKASEIDLRDLKLYKEILSSDASDTIKRDANLRIKKINERLDIRSGITDTKPYSKEGSGWLKRVEAVYYDSGKAKGKVYVVPIPKEYKNKSGATVNGFYAVVPEDGYTDAGDIKLFWIQNIGGDEVLDVWDDLKISIDMNTYKEESGMSFLGVEGNDFSTLRRDALEAIRTANRNYGRNSFTLFGSIINADVKSKIDERRCTDFMTADECKLLFNVCDPVLCPSSRCDLGGKYRVDNVIQQGVIGSIALCLPNAKEGIIVPVCLSGIHAGLENYLSIMTSYRDCLKENLETGKMVGICDEIHSVYLCEFFWRNMVPFMDQLLINFFESIEGQGMKGGGEYLTVQDAWKNLEDSVNFMKNEYGVNAMKAFRARSTGEIGTDFCKVFVSARYPTNKNFFDALLQPDSPIQFMAWFDEIAYTEATVPATSQYKVYYHIYAGKDEGVNYQVYLRNPVESAYTKIQDVVVVATGYIVRGSYASQAKDFTAASGYKELCVRINGKDECGFKKVGTDFSLNYLSDKYYQEQAGKTDVRTEKECLSGVSSAYSLVNPNIQEGAQDVLSPSLDKKGVVRICSSDNPGISKEPQRWQDVGYCDDEKVRCWVDTNSVKDVIKNKEIEGKTVAEIGGVSEFMEEEKISLQESNSRLKLIESRIENLKSKVEGGEDYKTEVENMISELEEIEKGTSLGRIKAEAVYLKFKAYYEVSLGLWGGLLEQKKEEALTQSIETRGDICAINSVSIDNKQVYDNSKEVVILDTINPKTITVNGNNCNKKEISVKVINVDRKLVIKTITENFPASNFLTLNFGNMGWYDDSEYSLVISIKDGNSFTYYFKTAKKPISTSTPTLT